MVEKRAFGRTVLVGTHVVSDVMRFSPRELEEEPEDVPKGELLGEVPMEAAGRFCQWQRSLALPLPPNQAARFSPQSYKVPSKSMEWGRSGLDQVVILAPDWCLGSSSSSNQVMECCVRAGISLWGWQRAI